MKLVRYDAARRAIAEAHRIDEVKDIADKAKALLPSPRQSHPQLQLEPSS